MVQAAVVSGLLSAGCEVIDLGVCADAHAAARGALARRPGRRVHHRRAQSRRVERAQVRPRRRPLPQRHPGGGTARHRPPGRVREGDVGSHPHRRGRAGRDRPPPRGAGGGLRRGRRAPPRPPGGGRLLQRRLGAALAAVARACSGARCWPSTTTRRRRSRTGPSRSPRRWRS
ncbi:MAG: hypothetical protein MZV70_07815 [Desulfobacterales bacterium]|nr:hypothetical protein [Desulfobacterales bacterium]